jgi:phosphoribosylanthranilate isomerase
MPFVILHESPSGLSSNQCFASLAVTSEIMKNDVRTRIKICGITNLDDGLLAARAGADYLGYVFHEKSARNISDSAVRDIIGVIRTSFPDVHHVGVVVDEAVDRLVELAFITGLDYLQLHGNETPQRCRALHDEGIRLIKALKFGEGAPAVNPAEYVVEFLLADTFDANMAGGTGKALDPGAVPDGFPFERAFIGGGLTSNTVAHTIRRFSPYAIDVSSGVEDSPGKKSHSLIREFIKAVRDADQSEPKKEKI